MGSLGRKGKKQFRRGRNVWRYFRSTYRYSTKRNAPAQFVMVETLAVVVSGMRNDCRLGEGNLRQLRRRKTYQQKRDESRAKNSSVTAYAGKFLPRTRHSHHRALVFFGCCHPGISFLAQDVSSVEKRSFRNGKEDFI